MIVIDMCKEHKSITF